MDGDMDVIGHVRRVEILVNASRPTALALGDTCRIESNERNRAARREPAKVSVSHATGLPFASRPARRSTNCGGPLGSQPCSSCRIHCRRTGLPTSREKLQHRRTHLHSRSVHSSPNLRGKQTALYPAAARSSRKRSHETSAVDWEAVQTVSPSGLKSATAQDGPIDACPWYPVNSSRTA